MYDSCGWHKYFTNTNFGNNPIETIHEEYNRDDVYK